VYSNTTPGTYTVTATSQQDTTKTANVTVTVVNGVNNVLPIVVDGGPPSLVAQGNVYVNGAFATVTVCPPGSTTCQTIDHVLVDTGSIGLRLLAQGAAGGELDPTSFPLQTNASGNPIAQCYGFVDGFVWGSVSLATINLTYTNQTPAEAASSVPIQIIGDPRVPSVPSSCSASGVNESNLSAFMANGVLGVGVFQQDCGAACTSGTPPNIYYSCSGGTCTPTLQALAQQVPNPDFVLPADNNGVLIQLPSVPAGGTTAISGNLIFGIGTQTNNVLGSATVFNTDGNGNFVSIFNGQTNSCSYIDSGSNGYFFPSAGYPGLIACSGNNSSFYCPSTLLALSASNSSAANTNGSTGSVSFNVGNANTLLSGNNIAFSELGGPNSPVNGCSSFGWGLSFFYGKPNGVFTGIEQQPVTGVTLNGKTVTGPFWAY
jgi:hypothetical protein